MSRRRPGGYRPVQPLPEERLIEVAVFVVKGFALWCAGASLLHHCHDCSSSFIGYWDTEVMRSIVRSTVPAYYGGTAAWQPLAKRCEIA